MKQMIDMMITMSLPALNSENPWRDTANWWVSFWLHTPRFFLCFQAFCWNLTVPVRVLILPTFPPSPKLLSILVFSKTLCFPHLELCHCYLFLPSAKFWTRNNPSTDCLCWLRFKWDESNISSLTASVGLTSAAAQCWLCRHSKVFKKWQVSVSA